MTTSAIAHRDVDFLSCLPQELVLNILSYLSSEDCVHCRSVSKSWREVLGGFPSYWTERACREFGLPRYLITECTKKGDSPISLFVAAHKQRQLITNGRQVVVKDLLELTQSKAAASMQHVNQIVSAGNGVLVAVTIDRSVSARTHSSLTSQGYSPQGLPVFVFNPPKCLIKEIMLYKINETSGYFQPFSTLHFPGRWSLVAKLTPMKTLTGSFWFFTMLMATGRRLTARSPHQI